MFLTCRTNHAATLSKYFDDTYVLSGYQDSSRIEFIKKYAGETGCPEQTFDVLMRDHDTSPALSELMKTPLYLSYLCILVEDDQGHLPKTRTEIYQNITQLVVTKTSQRLGLEIEKCNQAFGELCNIAFRGIIVNKLEFKEIDLSGVCNMTSLVMQFGFLTQKMSRSRLAPEKLMSFNHKTMQEFLATNHVKRMKKEDRHSLLNKKKNDKNWTMVIVFLCGLLRGNEDELDKLYRHVICKDLHTSLEKTTSICDTDYLHREYHLGIQCIGESGIFDTFEELASRIVPHSFVLACSEGCYYCIRGLEVASKMVLPHKPEVVVYGPELVPFQSYKHMFRHLLLNCTYHQSLVLSNTSGVWGLVQIIKAFPPLCKTLEHLYIYMTPMFVPSAELLEKNDPEVDTALENLLSIKSLVFQGPQSLYGQGTEQIAKEVQYILRKILYHVVPHIQTLVLQNQILSESTAMLLETCIRECQNLRKLYLVDIQMEDRCLIRVFKDLETRKEIISLGLSGCAQIISEEARTALIKSVGNMITRNHLTLLTLANMDLQATDISSFLEAFSGLKSLRQLTLGGTVFSEKNKLEVIDAIANLKSLKVLKMIRFGVSGGALPVFTDSLKYLGVLEDVQIISDDIGGCEGFSDLCKTLSQRKQLETVILENCKITDGNIEALKELFQILNLKKLSLMANNIGSTETGVIQLVNGIAQSCTLQELHLYIETFTDHIIQIMVDSMAANNTQLRSLIIKVKPGMHLAAMEFDKLYKLYKEGITSLKTFKFGMAIVGYSMQPHQTEHEHWRSECLED